MFGEMTNASALSEKKPPLTGASWPKAVKCRDLVGVAITPVSKKLAIQKL